MNSILPIITLTTLVCGSFAEEEAETRFFLGEKGALDCDGGVPVTDKATCDIGCKELNMTLGSELADGFLCFQGNQGVGERVKGSCHQDGNNGKKARLVCDKIVPQ